MKLNEYLLESLKKTTIDVQDAINIKCGQLDKNKFKLSNIQDFDNVFDFIVSDNCLLASPTDIKELLGDDVDELLKSIKNKTDEKEADNSIKVDESEDNESEDNESKDNESGMDIQQKCLIKICDSLFGITINELYFYKWIYKQDDIYMIGTNVKNQKYIKIIERIL